MTIFIALIALSAVGIAVTVRDLFTDGYRRARSR